MKEIYLEVANATLQQGFSGGKKMVATENSRQTRCFPGFAGGQGAQLLGGGVGPIIPTVGTDDNITGGDGSHQIVLVEVVGEILLPVFIIIFAEPMGEAQNVADGLTSAGSTIGSLGGQSCSAVCKSGAGTTGAVGEGILEPGVQHSGDQGGFAQAGMPQWKIP